jgi:hypothetical protein
VYVYVYVCVYVRVRACVRAQVDGSSSSPPESIAVVVAVFSREDRGWQASRRANAVCYI